MTLSGVARALTQCFLSVLPHQKKAALSTYVVEKNLLLLNFGGRNNNKIRVSFIKCFIMTHQNNYLKRLTMLVAYHFLKVEQLAVI